MLSADGSIRRLESVCTVWYRLDATSGASHNCSSTFCPTLSPSGNRTLCKPCAGRIRACVFAIGFMRAQAWTRSGVQQSAPASFIHMIELCPTTRALENAYNCCYRLHATSGATGYCRPSFCPTLSCSYDRLMCKHCGPWTCPWFLLSVWCDVRSGREVESNILLHPVSSLWENFAQTFEPLNMRPISDIDLMRSQERTEFANQHFVQSSSIPMIDLCANVRPFEHARNFRFRIDATSWCFLWN